jgi:SAM-dependent methyltransferase
VTQPGPLSSLYFDSWYLDMAASPQKDRLVQRVLGLPPDLLSSSLLSWDALDEVVGAARLSAGNTLLDVACGRGGYSLEVSARTGARLLGVDLSGEAVCKASDSARARSADARFLVGSFDALGLDCACVDAVMCIDSIQFAPDLGAALREFSRVLVPGGRVVLTSWEAVDRMDWRVPERLRRLRLHEGLTAAGFAGVAVLDRPAWSGTERTVWQEAAALDPGQDAALASLHREALRALETFDRKVRKLAVATKP